MIKNTWDLGNAQVGYYTIASIFLAFVIIPQMLGKSIIPKLINEHDINNNSFSKNFSYLWMQWYGLVLFYYPILVF